MGLLQEGHGMLHGEAVEMAGIGGGGVGGVPQRQQNVGGQIFGQIKGRSHGGDVKGADPAGAHAQRLSGQHHLGGGDGAIHLGHGVIHDGAVAGHLGVAADQEYRIGTVALLDGAHFCERLLRADNEDPLRLQVHGGGSDATRLQNLVQNIVGNGGIGKGAEGVALLTELEKIHGISPFGCWHYYSTDAARCQAAGQGKKNKSHFSPQKTY